MPDTNQNQYIDADLTWNAENAPLSHFPAKPCDMYRLSDPSADQLPLIAQYNRYSSEGNSTACATILLENPDLIKSFINTDVINTLLDELKATQHCLLTQIEDLVNKVAQNAIGINDDSPTAVSAYSGQKVEEMKRQINIAMHTKVVTLTAAGWSNSYPYSQTVSVPTARAASDVKVLGPYTAGNTSAEQDKAYVKACSFLKGNDNGTADGSITFLAYKKPTIDFKVVIEGVE